MRLKRSQSFIIAGGVLVLFFAASIGFMNTKKSPPTVAEMEEAERTARVTETDSEGAEADKEDTAASTFVLDKFHRSETKGGRTVWEIKAERGKYFPESNTAKIEDATLWFFKEDGQTATLEAAKADVLMDGPSIKKADATGGVVLKLEDKATLKTEKATYFHKENTVTAPGKVHITSEFVTTSGNKLEGNIETKEFTLFNDVESVIKPFKKKKKS